MTRDILLLAPEARAVEHLESAILQADPRRRLALVALALKAAPDSPLVHGVLALSLPALGDAARHLDVAAGPAPTRAGPGLSGTLQAVRALCAAVRDLAAQDPHGAVERTGPLLRGGALGPLGIALVRTHMAAAAACNDLDRLSEGLAFARRMPESFALELPWFEYILALGLGKPEAALLAGKAARDAGCLLDGVLAPGPDAPVGNVGHLGRADAGVARAAVLPGLFAARPDWTAFALAA